MTVAIRKLREVCSISMGQAPNGETYNDKRLGLPLIAGAGDFGPDFPIAKKFTSAPTKTCQPGDIIMSIRATIGTKILSDGVYCLGRGVAGLRPTNEIDGRYLWHWLGSARNNLASLGRGATFPQVSREDIEGLEISLPPLDEQRRIAAILDKADDLRRKRKAAIKLLDGLTQSIFLEMFEAAAHASTIKLENFAEIQVGFAFKSSEYSSKTEDIRLCRGANVLPNNIDWSDIVRWPMQRQNEFSEYQLQSGDVVIAMDRPWISSGFKAAQISASDLPALLVQRVARLRPKTEVDGYFLYALVRSSFFSEHFKPTETTVPHISPVEIRNFTFNLPVREIREKFAMSAAHARSVLRAATASLVNIELSFSSLQSRAFSGQL